MQDKIDPTLYHLSWDRPNIPGLLCYQIRRYDNPEDVKWKLDPTNPKNVDPNQIIKLPADATSVDVQLFNESDGIVKNVAFLIAAYSNTLKRSEKTARIDLTANVSPSKVPILTVAQDANNKRLLHFNWSPSPDAVKSSFNRYILVIEEENCTPVHCGIKNGVTSYDYTISHGGLLKSYIIVEMKAGTSNPVPEYNLYNVDITPPPVTNLSFTYQNGNFSLDFTKPNDYLLDLEYAFTVEKVNQKVKSYTHNGKNVSAGSTELTGGINYVDQSYTQGVSITDSVTTWTPIVIPIKEELLPGVFKATVSVHRHTYYIDKDGNRQNCLYESEPVSVYLAVS